MYAQILTLLIVASMALATPRILIYSTTAGYRHDSIPTATAALKRLGQENNIAFDSTEDENQFNDSNLADYDALLFLSNSDEGKPKTSALRAVAYTGASHAVLNDSGKQAFKNYLNKGGNYVGIHAASACLFNTTFYQKEVGE
ncbi:hypothetical protein FRC12_023859 [Ceratobasidium sp. 428]|nr:hypothetical protein FRC12_023859 [Ceratobasidium sp. 428]